MNNPNPFVPKGSILEAQSKRRSRLKLAVFCVIAVGVAGLSAMLIQGCKREQPTEGTEASTSLVDTNPVVMADTNPPVNTNPPISYVPPVTNPAPYIPPAAPATTTYKIAPHDTYSIIGKKFGVSAKALEAANPTKPATKLKVGDTITIPAPAAGAATPSTTAPAATDVSAGGDTYKVKSGDTLGTIAKAHGVSLKALVAANNLTPDQINHIRVNQPLKIPAKTEAAAPVVTTPVSPAPPVDSMPVMTGTPPPSTTPAH